MCAMKTITIKTKDYTQQQAHQLLKQNGWTDDITAFLAGLPANASFTSLTNFKCQFRQWREERNQRLAWEAWNKGFDELLKLPNMAEAYRVTLAGFQSKSARRGRK